MVRGIVGSFTRMPGRKPTAKVKLGDFETPSAKRESEGPRGRANLPAAKAPVAIGEPTVTFARSALEALPVAIYTTDAEGMIDFFNDEAAELWGRRHELGTRRWCGALRLHASDGRVVPPDQSPVAQLLRDGSATRGEAWSVERPDGELAPCKSYATALKDGFGHLVGAMHIMVDEAARRRAVLEANRLAAIVEGSDDAIMSKTLDGVVTSWNAGAARIFGWSEEDMIGRPITEIIPLELRDEETKIISALRAGERIAHFDTVRVARDGRRIDVSLSVSPIRDAEGAIVGASKIARDITHRKRAETAARDAARAAERARREAEAANQEKTNFLAVMSHEIRTPMTSIAGFVDLLARSSELTAEQQRYVGLIQSANAALLTTVNDILDFSKVEAGRLELELAPFSIARAISGVIDITRPAATAKRIDLRQKIDPSVPDWVLGDANRLRQVLLNLLNNAMKFTESGAVSVDVQTRRSPDGLRRLLFSVADTGVGIPAQQQHRLFKKFSQVDSAFNRRHGGAGLGLAICKQLVELMDGEIGVVSEAGKGATVWFTAVLPGVAEPSAVVAPRSVPAPARGGRVLLVDDLDTNLEIVGYYLKEDGYRVEARDNAAAAISLLKKEPFDLVLMDIQMPELDGVAATRVIRAMDPPLGRIPIIALTGNVLPQQIQSFLDAGMNDHVGKPIDRDHLHEKVALWMESPGGAVPPRAPAAMDFDPSKFESFLANFGSAWVEEHAGKFAKTLEAAFASTIDCSRREAHQLLNFAGLLGFDRLVELCRDVETMSPDDPAALARAFEDLRAERAAALRRLKDVVLPATRATIVAGAIGMRDSAVPNRSV